MKLTLSHTDISNALLNFVTGSVAVQEGMDVRIELKVSRGVPTAIVNIVPEGTPEEEKPTRAAYVPKEGAKPRGRPRANGGLGVAAVVEQAKTVVNEEGPVDTDVQVDQEEVEQAEVAVAQPATKLATKSLFGALKKPA